MKTKSDYFKIAFRESEIMITEGSLAQRLKTEFKVTFDEYINHAGFIYSNPEILTRIYKQYIDIGKQYKLPILITTPTRNVNYETKAKSGYPHNNIHADAIAFLKEIRDDYDEYSNNIYIGGMVGCRGDAYSGNNHLNSQDAYNFHKVQINEILSRKPDFILGTLMPSLDETIGMSSALSESSIPYIISFMIRKDGRLMDGTPITEAIKFIDSEVENQPECYITNCIHPTNLLEAINCELNKNKPELLRLLGIQANASTLSPEELDLCTTTKQSDFDTMVKEMVILKMNHNFRIFGGCCGTDDKFINKLARRLIQS